MQIAIFFFEKILFIDCRLISLLCSAIYSAIMKSKKVYDVYYHVPIHYIIQINDEVMVNIVYTKHYSLLFIKIMFNYLVYLFNSFQGFDFDDRKNDWYILIFFVLYHNTICNIKYYIVHCTVQYFNEQLFIILHLAYIFFAFALAYYVAIACTLYC